MIESVSGGTHWGGGMLIHAEDQARLGLLMLRRGEWNGKQMLPESWIAESLRPCPLKPTYGLLWWLNTGHGRYTSAPASSFLRIGRGRQSNLGRSRITIWSRSCGGWIRPRSIRSSD